MADRENKYDRVKAYDRNDWSFGLNVSRAEKLLQKQKALKNSIRITTLNGTRRIADLLKF